MQEASQVKHDPSAALEHSPDTAAAFPEGEIADDRTEMKNATATDKLDMADDTPILSSSSSPPEVACELDANDHDDMERAPTELSGAEHANTGLVESGDAGNGMDPVDGIS